MDVSNMTITDFEKIENNLQKDFDDFWNTNILRQELENSNCRYLVAKENNEIIGFVGVLLNIDQAEIMNIVVKKDKRGLGIGKKLLKEIIELVKKNNLSKITLEVNSKNEAAKKMYENIGFEVIGIRKKYYNNVDDAIIMNLVLKD